MNENSNNGFSVGGSSNSSAAPTPVDEENSDDLPMTIKIDPPFIRDIDEDEDNWDSRKDSTTQVSNFYIFRVSLNVLIKRECY